MDDKNSLGIQSIYEVCYSLYSDQPTPPQVTAIHKFWLGGPDPLDYISMYENNGSNNDGSPPHWHYVTYGLSDLYGDSRIHGQSSNVGPSGFGFELTFRLKRSLKENKAPLWPAMLLQNLSRYLFRSQAKFVAGDHIPWGRSLEDVQETGLCDSRITNMIVCTDPQLSRVTSPYGTIDFLQIVGICDEEMQLARTWNGIEVISAMQKRSETGGKLLVTDMRRGESLTDLEINVAESDGSSMSGVTTEVSWDSWRGIEEMSEDIIDVVGDCYNESSTYSQVESNTPFYGINMSPGTLELFPPRFLNNVHVKISKAAAEIIRFVITHRLKHGRHFTFLHCRSDTAITLVTESITGAFVNEERPFGFRGSWLQIFLSKDFLNELESKFSLLTKIDIHQLPLHLKFARFKLQFSVHNSNDPELDKSPPIYDPTVSN